MIYMENGKAGNVRNKKLSNLSQSKCWITTSLHQVTRETYGTEGIKTRSSFHLNFLRLNVICIAFAFIYISVPCHWALLPFWELIAYFFKKLIMSIKFITAECHCRKMNLSALLWRNEPLAIPVSVFATCVFQWLKGHFLDVSQSTESREN